MHPSPPALVGCVWSGRQNFGPSYRIVSGGPSGATRSGILRSSGSTCGPTAVSLRQLQWLRRSLWFRLLTCLRQSLLLGKEGCLPLPRGILLPTGGQGREVSGSLSRDWDMTRGRNVTWGRDVTWSRDVTRGRDVTQGQGQGGDPGPGRAREVT